MEKIGLGEQRVARQAGVATWLLPLALLTAAGCGGGGGQADAGGGPLGDDGGPGSMNGGDAGGPVTLSCTGKAGSIEGAWRAKTAHVSAFLFTNNSGALPESEEHDLVVPELTLNPLSGEEARVLSEIDGLTRRTYVWPKGRKFYYLMSEPLSKADDLYMPMGPNSAGGALGGTLTEILELKDGCLVSQGSLTTAPEGTSTVTLTNEVTFDRVKGPMPPSDWPTKKISVPTGSTP